MTNPIELLEQRQLRSDLPVFKAGDTVRVHFQVIEGQRRRVQVFEGIVIKRQGAGVRETFTVRKQSFGVGVERTFPLHSPKIEKIEVQAIGDVNRAKLYYLRAKVGKKARVREVQQGAAVSSARAEVEPSADGDEPVDEHARDPSTSSPLPKKLSALSQKQKSRLLPTKTGQRLLKFDRRLGARFVAGADEAGRGSLAGPLVVAGVLLDYDSLRDHRVRPLAQLNDSKQVSPEDREELFRAVLASAAGVSVQVVSPGEIDRVGLHRSNLNGLRRALHALSPPAEACLVDGFRLGPSAPDARRGRRRRRAERRDRGGLDRGEGRPRPGDAADGRALSALRVLVARRVHHAAPLAARPRARPVPHPPPLVPGALLPE